MQIELVQYSAKSFALFGEDTKKVKDQLMKMNGKYNRHLRHPETPEDRTPGYIFSLKQLEPVKSFLATI